jgi:hypothetical protein
MSARSSIRNAAIVVVLGAGLVAARGLAPRDAHAAAAGLPSGDEALELVVPHVVGDITLDGDTDDSGWRGPTGRTGAFVGADGQDARPHSEARFAWGDGHLYVELYAADEDIHASHETPDGPVWNGDAFQLVFSDGVNERAIDVSALGTLTDGTRPAHAKTPGAPRPFDYAWSSGAHVSHEIDGTPNDGADMDEEWVIEMAVPFDALGIAGRKGDRVALSIRRCDTLKSGQRSCGTWGQGEHRGVLVLD